MRTIIFGTAMERKWPSIFYLGYFSILFVHGLYEDQIGKFDWRLENVGNVQHAIFDASTKYKNILVGSEENVIASLTTTTGTIAWRHVMEETSRLLNMFTNSESNHHWLYTITESHLRKWNPSTGSLIWESSFPAQILKNNFVVTDNSIVLVLPTEVKGISLSSGEELWSVDTQQFDTPKITVSFADDVVYIVSHQGLAATVFIVGDEVIKLHKKVEMPANDLNCKSKAGVLACLNVLTSDVLFLNLPDQSTRPQVIKPQAGNSITLLSFEGASHLVVEGIKNNVLYKLSKSGAVKVFDYEGVGCLSRSPDNKEVVVTVHSSRNKVVDIKGFSLETGQDLYQYKQTVELSVTAPPRMITPFIYKRPDGSLSYRMLIVFQDLTLALVQQSGATLWLREEGLTSLAHLEMVDLPVSYVEAQMEEEFGAHASDNIIHQLVSRLTTQFQQFTSFLTHAYHKYVEGLRLTIETEDHTALDEDYLTRDEFNLHKLIVAVSRTGKIYGMDSFTGKVIWTRYIHSLAAFSSNKRILLFLQRSTAHFPHNPVAVVIGQDKLSSEGNSLLYSFNPITGEPYTSEPIRFKFKIDQAMLLPVTQQDFLKPVLMLDTLKQVHVYPSDAEVPGPLEYYIFSAQQETGSFVGLRVSGSSLQSLVAEPTWSVQLDERIVSLSSKPWRESVHSLGKVLPDRTVLYKYSNPNLISIITVNSLQTDYTSLNVYLLDAVSGRIIFTCEHKKSSPPVHMVHSENWVVYTYYNMRSRRVEIAVLELYEGLTQTNATAFTSLGPRINPIVERQAYILGTSVSALATTHTERGITGKNILLAHSTGGIVEVPKLLLDPRRPQTPTQASREEGLMPYMPELPQKFDWIINYNQSVSRIKEIHCEPAGLESTSLVVAYGLDIYYTKVAPSKMYDVLKDDFDYFFIGAVTIGMLVLSFISRHFALRKMVKRAWK